MARHHNSGDALIEILHTAQQLYGYLSRPLLKKIARGLKLPPSRVLAVATFYHLFRFSPAKAHSIVVCLGNRLLRGRREGIDVRSAAALRQESGGMDFGR